MIDKTQLKAIAFDFGGTLDSPFLHWMDIYIDIYTRELNLSLTKETFRDSYVYAEQTVEREQLIKPHYSLYETQSVKTHLQFASLVEKGILPDEDRYKDEIPCRAARLVTDYSSAYVKASKPVLETLMQRYKLLLVSNYYGNLLTIITDLGIRDCFYTVTDSTIAGIRKPDPALWKLAIEQAGFTPEQVLVVGDSMKNDIVPGLSLGCQVVQGCPASKELPADITAVRQLNELLTLLID